MARMSLERRRWWRSMLYRLAGAIVAVAVLVLVLEMLSRT